MGWGGFVLTPARRRREVYFTDEQAAWEQTLGIPNLSEYVRAKMQEDLGRRTPLTSLSDKIAAKRLELDALQLAFQSRALDQERALEVVDAAVAQVRRAVAHQGSRAAVQTTMLAWIRNNPNGRKVRDLLPASVSDRDVVDVLERWPESRTELIQLLEVRP